MPRALAVRIETAAVLGQVRAMISWRRSALGSFQAAM
jgi:hypothetical protein